MRLSLQEFGSGARTHLAADPSSPGGSGSARFGKKGRLCPSEKNATSVTSVALMDKMPKRAAPADAAPREAPLEPTRHEPRRQRDRSVRVSICAILVNAAAKARQLCGKATKSRGASPAAFLSPRCCRRHQPIHQRNKQKKCHAAAPVRTNRRARALSTCSCLAAAPCGSGSATWRMFRSNTLRRAATASTSRWRRRSRRAMDGARTFRSQRCATLSPPL